MAKDWNQWRGPARDGRVDGFEPKGAWPKTFKRAWRVEVGEGHSSPVVVGSAVYQVARMGDDELVRCLDLATGKERWKSPYPAPYEMNPAARGHGKGPKSTPVVAGGRVFALSIHGRLGAFDAKSGKPLWSRSAGKPTAPEFGTAMSPLVEGNTVVAHLGGHDEGLLAAFDVRTGAPKWTLDASPSYASPIVAAFDGVRQLITQTRTEAIGVDVATGKRLWSIPFTTPYEQNSVTAVRAGAGVLIGGLNQPAQLLVPRKDGVEKLWAARDASFYMSTAVVARGVIHGMSSRRSGQLIALDVASGKTLWTGEGRLGDNASLWTTERHTLVLTTGAELLVYGAKPDGALAEVARYTVAESPTWASPAFAGRRMLVKDLRWLTAWDLV